jgi:HAD superfamily hydrolase (TIGR01457 family)
MIAEGYDAFLFDLDGVLYRASEPVPGAAEAVEALRALGKRVAFLTNNSARTPEEVAAHLRSVGVEAAPEEVETSALSTAGFLRARDVSTAFVVGERGLRDALSAAGVRLLDGDPDAADAVVVGWDRRVDYEKLRVASVLVQRGARLVASNADPSYPAPGGVAWPGAGAILAAIEATTGVGADVVGKPNEPIFLAGLERAGGGRPLVIGDRLETDIEGAARLGWDSMLVLTGIASRADLGDAATTPTYVAEDLSALVAPR